MDTAHFSKPLAQNLSAQSTTAGASSNNQCFDCFCLLGKDSTSTIHSCQGTTASCNCTGHPLGREDDRPVRKPQVLGTRHGYSEKLNCNASTSALQKQLQWNPFVLPQCPPPTAQGTYSQEGHPLLQSTGTWWSRFKRPPSQSRPAIHPGKCGATNICPRDPVRCPHCPPGHQPPVKSEMLLMAYTAA